MSHKIINKFAIVYVCVVILDVSLSEDMNKISTHFMIQKKHSIQYRLKYSDIKKYYIYFLLWCFIFFAKGFHNINEK